MKSNIADYRQFFKRIEIDPRSGDGNYFRTDAGIAEMQKGYEDANE